MELRLENDEADLNMLFNSIKKGRDNFLAFLYGMLMIIKKLWLILLLVIIAGVAYGYYKQNYGAKKYKTSLIIQTNQNSTEMVYDYIDNISSYYLESQGFAPYEIVDLEIEAIPDFKNLLDNYENQNIDLIEYLLENASADDVLKAEFFRNSYRFHRLELELGYTFNDDTIDRFVDLLNSVENYKGINVFYDGFNDQKVLEFEKMITQLDLAIDEYNNGTPGSDTNLSVTSVNFREKNFITSLVEYKTYVLRFLENAKYEALTGKKNVFLVNEPIVKAERPFLPHVILFPIVFVILFFAAVYFIRALKKGKDIYESKQA